MKFSQSDFPGNISPLPDAAKFFATHKPALPKALVAALVKAEDEQAAAAAERAKWAPDAGLVAFREKAARATEDPTPRNLAALTNETERSMVARYAANNEECSRLQRGLVLKTHPIMVEVLAVLLPLVEAAMEQTEKANAASHERLGLDYEFQADGQLRSLAKLHANLSARLNNPGNPMRVEELVAIVGPLKR